MEKKRKPGVGVGVIVIKDGKLLLGQRKTHGKGTWSVPGGYLEWNESFADCGIRECQEETGITVGDVSFFYAENNILPEDDIHNVTIFLRGNHVAGEPILCEPEKFVNVGWYDLNDLPRPLFNPLAGLLNRFDLRKV